MIDLQFNRRDFMRVGSISAGLSAIGLSDIKAEDAPLCLSPNDKSVIWVWLGGGATQVETLKRSFDDPPVPQISIVLFPQSIFFE